MVESIKAVLRISDTGFGALQGLAFGLFYTLMAFPLGLLADRYSRRLVVMFGLIAFSAFSVFSGFARSYAQLFVARAGVGIGEATLMPSANAMIAETFRSEEHTSELQSLMSISEAVLSL